MWFAPRAAARRPGRCTARAVQCQALTGTCRAPRATRLIAGMSAGSEVRSKRLNPRRNTLLRSTAARGRSSGVLAVLSNQVLLGGQLVAVYGDADVAALRADGPGPEPRQVAFVDFHHASSDRYQRIGSLANAAARVLGQFSPGVSAIRTKVLLEPIDRLGRPSGRYCFDAKWTTAGIMARVNGGELSIVPVFSDSPEDDDLGAEGTEELRSMQARQSRAIASGRFYFAITPHDQPFTMLEVLPASRAARSSAIHEVSHQSINVDLIWDL
jgi:hypothetical protein